jgi:hypothetical protein
MDLGIDPCTDENENHQRNDADCQRLRHEHRLAGPPISSQSQGRCIVDTSQLRPARNP